MATVDPNDDNIKLYVVRLYAYDPEHRERRHQVVAAFDNEQEFIAPSMHTKRRSTAAAVWVRSSVPLTTT